jgi:hypothetical protein
MLSCCSYPWRLRFASLRAANDGVAESNRRANGLILPPLMWSKPLASDLHGPKPQRPHAYAGALVAKRRLPRPQTSTILRAPRGFMRGMHPFECRRVSLLTIIGVRSMSGTRCRCALFRTATTAHRLASALLLCAPPRRPSCSEIAASGAPRYAVVALRLGRPSLSGRLIA